MGTLVFQATLGGAVNIIGPNIANTINFTLPSADGTSGQTWTTNGSGVLAFGTLGIAGGGTGQITATAAFNALAPSQSGQSGKYLTTDGTNTSWGTNPLGTVTSVAATVPSFLSIAGSPITTSGTLAFTLSGTALPTTSGGTGLTSFTSGGVVYASSSSALATSSSLTFDGTILKIYGAANEMLRLDTVSTATDAAIRLYQAGVQKANIQAGVGATGGGLDIYSSGSTSIVFGNSSELMRLTSTGLGIGTSSPARKLDVVGAIRSAGVSNPYVEVNNGTSSGYLELRGGSNDLNIEVTGANSLLFRTNNALQATINSAGNLGLGVTPSAWASSSFAFQLGPRASLYGRGGLTVLANNYYDNGTNSIYIATGTASDYYQTAGTHVWRNAASGTAGNAISFTQAMTLTAAGNLLVGTTSALNDTARLEISAPTGAYIAATLKNDAGASNWNTQIWNAGTTGDAPLIQFATETSYTGRGSIVYNRASGLVVYATTSDYRAKDISGPVTGSGALIDSVPVYMGKMKGATQERPMFIAHETPTYAHMGVKDAVDADGNPVYQQMDASALIPVMWAEIQSLRQRLSAANL